MAAALGAVVLAVLAGVLASRPVPAGPRAAAPGRTALALTRDLPAGAVPGRGDLRAVDLPPAAVPADAIPPDGNRALGPLALAARRGDLLTHRLLGTGWAAAGALRGYTLPVGDGVEAGPLAPGDRVDVLAASRGQATTVVRTAPVLGLVPGTEGHAAQIVLGVTGPQAESLAAARAAGTLTLVQTPPPTTSG